MRIVALTGGIGSGKSTVSSRLLEDQNFSIIDCDKISRDIFVPQSWAYKAVVNRFGNGILDDKKEIMRKKLGEIVFSDKAKLNQLTSITGPAIMFAIIRQIFYNFIIGSPIVILDAPTLFESKSFMINICAEIVVIAVDQDIQIARVMQRDNCSKQEVLDRIKNQLPNEEKVKKASVTIWNNDSQEDFEMKIEFLKDKLIQKYAGTFSVSRQIFCLRGLMLLSMGVYAANFLLK